MATDLRISQIPKPVQTKKPERKLRFGAAVTVCIAAACQDQGEPRIVLCSDTRLDYADLYSGPRSQDHFSSAIS